MKILKRTAKVILWIVLILVLLFSGFYFGLNNNTVQNYLVDKTAEWLSAELKTKVTVGHVTIKFPKKIAFTDFYVEDQNHDTLLFAKELDVNIGFFSYEKQKISLSSLELNHARVKLTKYPKIPGLNIDFIIEYFEGSDTSTTSNGGFDFKLESGIVKNTTFSYKNLNHNDTDMIRMLNFNDLYLTDLNAQLYDFIFIKDSTYFFAKQMSFKDKCGLNVKSFTANTAIDDTFMRFANLKLITTESNINGYLGFDYSYWDAFDYFNDSIKMLVNIEKKGILSSNDVKYFADELYGFNKSVEVSGRLKGTVSRLKAKNLDIKYGKSSWFAGNVNITGLPDVEQAYFDIDIDNFQSDKNDVESIPLYPFSDTSFVELPANIELLKTIKFKGSFTGFYNDFVAYGVAQSDLGKIIADVNIKNNETTEAYSGNISAENFDIGKLFNISDVVNHTTFNAKIKGTGFSLMNAHASVTASIDNAEVNGYNYKNVSVDGAISKKLFNGKVTIDEPNVKLDFTGNIDFTGKLPLFEFKAGLEHVNLTKLHLIDRDESASLTTNCEMLLVGDNPDNLKGSVKLQNLIYSELDNELHIPELDFYADDYAAGGKNISLNSSVADISITGATQVMKTIDAFRNYISDYIPVVKKPVGYDAQQNFSFNIKLNNTDELFKIFQPDISIAPATYIQGRLNETGKNFSLILQSKSFAYGDFRFNDLKINSSTQNGLLISSVNSADLIVNDSLHIEDLNIEVLSKSDSATLTVHGGNKTDSLDTKFNLHLKAFFGPENVTRLSFLPESDIWVNQRIWKIYDNNAVVFEKGNIRFENFKAYSDTNETIYLNGLIGHSRDEILNSELHNFDLYLLRDVFNLYDIQLGGKVTGSVQMSSILDNMLMNGELFVKSFSFYGDTVGDATIKSDFISKENKFIVDAFVERDGSKRINIKGEYLISKKEDYIDFDIQLSRTNISTFQHYMSGLIHDLKGIVTADLRLIGNPKRPDFTGKGTIQKGSFVVDYLNTKYTLTNDFKIDENYIRFNNAALVDVNGHEAIINGAIYHDHLRKIEYDFKIKPQNFQVLNSYLGQNDMFYGTAYASGDVSIKGNPEKTVMVMKLMTNKETSINIPLATPEEVNEKSFINFINHDTSQIAIEAPNRFTDSGLDLDLNFMVTPDASIQLIFDQKIGDIIRGQGSGIIQMKILPDGDFKMYGDYKVESGNYLFTMQNVLGKYFTLEKGGTIKWSGDPYDAHVDLSARYSRFAGLYDLFQDTSENYKKRVPVDVILRLKNNLFNPDIDFDIDVQNISASDQVRVDRYLNDSEEKTRQVMSLLIFNRFTKPESFSGTDIGSSPDAATGVNATLSEFITKQLSSWASQINRNFNIDFNYTPGDQLTKEQYDIAVSTKLLDERLSLYTSFEFGAEEQSTSAANIVGDFIVEYDITPDGRFRAKAFNKSNSNTLITNFKAPYTQGVGWAYRKEFNSWKELIRNSRKESKAASKADTSDVKIKLP